MRAKKYLTTLYSVLFICVIPIYKLSAQDWNYQMGITSASFRYVSPVGQVQNSLQPDAGLHLSLERSNRFIDSAKTKSQFLRKLTYQVGLAINQFNSLGITQSIPFSYSSTFGGIVGGLGLKSNLGQGFSLQYRVITQVNKLLMGSQKMGNQVFNLQGNSQFDRIQFQLGGEIKLAKQVNSQTHVFAYFNEAWQLNTIQNDGSQFAINPLSFGFGIHYSPLH
jgi:hypothetical protein